MLKKFLLIMMAILSSFFPLFAEEVFHQSIINASYLSDFAFGAFPLSLWGDFGVTGVEILPNMQTRIYATMKAGLMERTLRQDPMTGSILDSTGYGYSVVFSDGEIFFEQELLKNPRTGEKMLSLKTSGRMRWEQAFATLKDIRQEAYGGIFAPEVGLFPEGGDVFLKGAPELSGDKYFMAASLYFGLDYQGSWLSSYGSNSYGISFGVDLAPHWFLNDLWFIDEVYTDAVKVSLNGAWNIRFLDARTKSGRARYSIQMQNTLLSEVLFGSSIPRYMLDRSFMGNYIVSRNFHTALQSKIIFNGPEILIEGTYPQVYAYLQNSINSGGILNSVDTDGGAFEFFGGVGVGANLYVMKYFNFFAEIKYIYTDNDIVARGLDYSMGVYFNLFV